ncbi:Scr1 family TA system antitoxin-like transcriptional regulator [Streptosporangium sp. NPDC051023]|uniref:Scr1 family TA system antitoxin-like transcriptional regulator n=1 Tax=Streptosporangium sp. NPDC051023 TaxID=3155410 RepID=UPI0034508813
MRGQLEHLLKATMRPRVTIQVIPFDVGAYAALTPPSWCSPSKAPPTSCTWRTRKPHRF